MCDHNTGISVKLFEVELEGKTLSFNLIPENGNMKPSYENNMNEPTRMNS